jgi:hypothetical protein
MTLPPCVVVHGLADARRALARRRPVTLLSAPGAALFLGPVLWQALVSEARAEHPDVTVADILDCADATGIALASLRLGLRRIVLWPEASARQSVLGVAASLGATVLDQAPPAIDLATWLTGPGG